MATKTRLRDPHVSMGLAIPFAEGLQAHREGTPRADNPYADDDETSDAWLDGWGRGGGWRLTRLHDAGSNLWAAPGRCATSVRSLHIL